MVRTKSSNSLFFNINNTKHQSHLSFRNNPLLKRLHDQAKADAKRKHAQTIKKKQRNPTNRTKRKVDSVRFSQESRTARVFYIKRMEETICRTEGANLQTIADKEAQRKDTVEVLKKIQKLEEREFQERLRSLSQRCEESCQGDNISYGPSSDSTGDDLITLFENPTSNIAHDLPSWPFEDWPMNCEGRWEEAMQMLRNDDDLDVPVRPPCYMEDAPYVIPENKKISVETGFTKVHGSPVSVV